MLPPERIVGLLSTVVAATSSSSSTSSNGNSSSSDEKVDIEVGLDILYSTTNLLEDAAAQVAAGGRHSAEISGLLHKNKTRISSLLQSRDSFSRWTGLCLVKAGIETSSTFLQQSVAPWMPVLLKLASRPDGENNGMVTERAIATLTRIFVLVKDRPTLSRELASPHLPSFCQLLLLLLSQSAGSVGTSGTAGTVGTVYPQTLLETTLQSMAQILKSHPTTFRPQQPKALALIRSLLFDSSSPDQIVSAATAVYTLLIRCAPPKTQPEQWVGLFADTISDAQQTCDVLFACLVEETTSGRKPAAPEIDAKIDTGMTIKRLGVLLGVLRSLLSQSTTTTFDLSVPVSPLMSLLDRLFAVRSDTKPRPASSLARYHLVISSLPKIWTAGVALTITVIARLSQHSPSLALQLLHPLSFVFPSTTTSSSLRALVYTALSHILSLIGRTLSHRETLPILEIFVAACDDIVPPPPPVIITNEPRPPSSMLLTQPTSSSSSTYKKRKAPAPQNKANTPAASAVHPDHFLSSSSSSSSSHLSQDDTPLVSAAKTLLTTVLLNINCIPSEVRSKIERTVVLSAHSPGLLAAVLHPSTKKRGGSLLPHLVAAAAAAHSPQKEHALLDMAIEATLYPRMQVVKPAVIQTAADGGSVLNSPVEGRFWPVAVSPRSVVESVSIDEVITSPPEVGILTDPPPDEESYPPPPPPPVPQHATLPAPSSSPKKSQSTAIPAGAMSPPLSTPRNHNSGPINGTSSNDNPTNNGNSGGNGGGRNMFMPMPSPGRVHAALPPSPLRQSMSIFESGEEGKERSTKRLKIEDARSPLSIVEAVSPIDDSDDDAEIPEIHMASDEE